MDENAKDGEPQAGQAQKSKTKQGPKARDSYSHIYQFKISLKDIKPLIWRRIQVPENYTFWDLHVAIQDAMGWTDSHLHQFTLFEPLTRQTIHVGQPDDEFPSHFEFLLERETKIQKWFSPGRKNAVYEYDFGDSWLHQVTFEKMLPRENDTKYPRCIGGARACPLEDCGGVCGYQDLLKGGSDYPEEYQDIDPEYFKISEIKFDDPKKRLRYLGK